MDKDVLNFKEFKEYLGIGKDTALKLLQSGQVASFRIGTNYKICKCDILKYIDEQKDLAKVS